MRISFTKSEKDFPHVMINNAPLEVVPHAKILGLNVSDNLKWNYHISELVKKSSKRLYFLTQLKRAKVGCLELVQFFKSCIRSLIEYACPDISRWSPYVSFERSRNYSKMSNANHLPNRILRRCLIIIRSNFPIPTAPTDYQQSLPKYYER